MKKLLVVDDEPSILTLLKFNLEQSGFEVLTAENGNDALEIATNEDLTLIVLDLMLPGMDAWMCVKHSARKKLIHLF